MSLKSEKVIQEKSWDIPMFRELVVGDPKYIEEGNKKIVYSKKFRQKDSWVGRICLKQIEQIYDLEGSDLECTQYECMLCVAPESRVLSVYMDSKIYVGQRLCDISIGVDTAQYTIETENSSEDIMTAADGWWGQVGEVKKGSTLQGIMVRLSFPEDEEFETWEKMLIRLFGKKEGISC